HRARRRIHRGRRLRPHLVGIVGCYRLEATKERHIARIWGMYIAPEARGRGIGRLMLDVVITLTREWLELDHLWLHVMRHPTAARLAKLDWEAIEQSLGEWGYARTPPMLTADECASLIALYSEESRFRSRVDMARYRFGIGDYKYFAHPLPPVVADLRAHAYPPLARIANRWEK